MKTTKDILSAVIEDARYYLKRNVPDMRIDPKVVLDMAMDAERCDELEAESQRLAAQLKLSRESRAETERLREVAVKHWDDFREENRNILAQLAELEGYLQQSKDDYELALRETERLRAGLEKVREVEARLRGSVVTYGVEGDMRSECFLSANEAVDLAEVLAGLEK